MTSVPESVASSVTSESSTLQNYHIRDRKRRDNINDRINDLLSAIPPEFFESNANEEESGTKAKMAGTKDGKPNKGQILTQAVEYILHLQNEVDARNREEVELMFTLQELAKKTGTTINDINLENTIAEIMLARLGVGPLGMPKTASKGKAKDRSKVKEENTSSQQSIPLPTTNFEYGGYAEYENGSS